METTIYDTAPSDQDADLGLDFSRLDHGVRKRLRELCRLDNHHAPLGVLQDYLAVAVCVYLCVGVSYAFYPVALIVIGSTHRSFANLLHDCAHKILAKNGTLNLILGTVCSGYLIFHMLNPYRSSHIGFHHRFLGDPEKDPDYSFHIQAGIYDHRSSDRSFLLRHIASAAVGLRSLEYVKYIFRDRIMFDSRNAAVSMPIRASTERWLMLLEWGSIVALFAWLGWLPYLLIFWLVPLFTAGIAIGWISELAEHYPLPESEGKPILMTRNRHGWAVERYLFGRHHDNYHLVHHLNTGIPFWHMKRAHGILLEDPAYARWDALWAGILTRGRGRPDGETMLSYASKYRRWRREGGDPARCGGPTFAEMTVLARAAARASRP